MSIEKFRRDHPYSGPYSSEQEAKEWAREAYKVYKHLEFPFAPNDEIFFDVVQTDHGWIVVQDVREK
jgi:hypothetical protein